MLTTAAVVTDIRTGRISNRLIVSGLTAGLFFRIAESGWTGCIVFLLNVSVPVILCYLLFLIHALGAGDIKLFSVIGGIWNLKILTVTMTLSFLVAAGMSLCRLLYYHELVHGLCRFGTYVRQCLATGKLAEYPPEYREKQHIIHFSVGIWIGFIIALEVAY